MRRYTVVDGDAGQAWFEEGLFPAELTAFIARSGWDYRIFHNVPGPPPEKEE